MKVLGRAFVSFLTYIFSMEDISPYLPVGKEKAKILLDMNLQGEPRHKLYSYNIFGEHFPL